MRQTFTTFANSNADANVLLIDYCKRQYHGKSIMINRTVEDENTLPPMSIHDVLES